MIIPGIYASAISGHLYSNSYTSISTATVDAAGTATVTFNSIPQGYTHLQIRAIARTDRGVAGTGFNMVINSDTGANYARHNIYGDGATVAVAGQGSMSNMIIGRSISTAANIFTDYVIDILDYANTNKYKTVRTLSGWDANGSGAIAFSSGLWISTAAVTSLTFADTGQNLTQYSQFALYGVN